ncbi:MAG: GNAT family N-acetyltransferase [Dysgonamonadaceae bacterium]|jgi:GNAT superfamily N-acetyltransferase|nr:GNAT family N-acetyltransferase [Dysgonamonadaceae bacterium]
MKGIDFDWKVKRLELNTNIKPFESEDSDLNDFLTNDAKNYLAQMLAVTYLIETETETIAYFSLLNDNLKRSIQRDLSEEESKIWNRLNRKVPNRKRKGTYPAVKIGRLAVSKKYAGSGFGKFIIQSVTSMYLDNEQKAGCRFITVDAYSSAYGFYEKNGFNFLTDKDIDKSERTMFYDLIAV